MIQLHQNSTWVHQCNHDCTHCSLGRWRTSGPLPTGCRRSCVSLRKSRDCASRCGDSCISMRKLAESTRTPSQNCFKISYYSYSLVKYCAHGTSDILMVMYAVFLFHITRFYPRILFTDPLPHQTAQSGGSILLLSPVFLADSMVNRAFKCWHLLFSWRFDNALVTVTSNKRPYCDICMGFAFSFLVVSMDINLVHLDVGANPASCISMRPTLPPLSLVHFAEAQWQSRRP